MEHESPTIVVVDDAVEVRVLVRTRIRVSGRLRLVGEGPTERRRSRWPGAPARPDAARRLDARHGRPGRRCPGAGGLAADPGRAVQRLRGARPRRQGQAARRGRVHREVRARRRSSSTGCWRCSPRTAPASGTPAGAHWRPPAGTWPGRPGRPGRAPRAVPGGLRGGRDRHGDDDPDRPAGAGQPRAGRAGASIRPRTWSASFYGELTDGQADAARRGPRGDPAAARRRRPARARAAPARPTTAGCARRLAPVRDSAGRALYLFLQVQDVTAERAASRSSAGARSGSGCWSRRWRTTRSSCSTRTGTSSAGTPARSAARATRPRRSSASTSGSSTRRGAAGPAAPRARARARPARRPLRGGGLARPQGRHPLLGQRPDHRGVQRAASTSGSPRSPGTPASAAARAGAEQAYGLAAQRELSANARLKQAADDQSQFLAVTAHELRTPIGVLGGSAETLARHWADLDRRRARRAARGDGRRAPSGCGGCSPTC